MGSRRGIALVVAIIALAVIGLLVAGAHLAAMREQQRGDRRLLQTEALAAAEYGVERAAANARVAAWTALAPGSVDTMGPWTVGRSSVSVRVTRLGDSLQPLALIEGTATAGSWSTRRARRATSLTLALRQPHFAPLGALTVGGPVRLGPGAIVEGADLAPLGWSCPVPGPALPGVATPDATSVSSLCGPSCIGGAPPVDQLVAASDSLTYVGFGELGWAELASGAVAASGTVVPTPVSGAGGACLTSDPANWGDPDRATPPGACEAYMPIIHAPGDLHLAGGAGQGVLLVDGDLTISGGARFAGIVIARGALHAAGVGGRIEGAAMAAALAGGTSGIDAPLVIAHSRCAISAAAQGALRPVPIPFRAWTEVY